MLFVQLETKSSNSKSSNYTFNITCKCYAFLSSQAVWAETWSYIHASKCLKHSVPQSLKNVEVIITQLSKTDCEAYEVTFTGSLTSALSGIFNQWTEGDARILSIWWGLWGVTGRTMNIHQFSLYSGRKVGHLPVYLKIAASLSANHQKLAKEGFMCLSASW